MKQEEIDLIKKLLHYGPLSGCLIWKSNGENATHMPHDHGVFKIIKLCVLVDGKVYYAPDVCWLLKTGEWPESGVQCRGAELNLKWENLRLKKKAITPENKEDLEQRIIDKKVKEYQKTSKQNTSGRVGVYQKKGRKWWFARINDGEKQIHLGQFETFEKACDAREKAELYYARKGTKDAWC